MVNIALGVHLSGRKNFENRQRTWSESAKLSNSDSALLESKSDDVAQEKLCAKAYGEASAKISAQSLSPRSLPRSKEGKLNTI